MFAFEVARRDCLDGRRKDAAVHARRRHACLPFGFQREVAVPTVNDEQLSANSGGYIGTRLKIQLRQDQGITTPRDGDRLRNCFNCPGGSFEHEYSGVATSFDCDQNIYQSVRAIDLAGCESRDGPAHLDFSRRVQASPTVSLKKLKRRSATTGGE